MKKARMAMLLAAVFFAANLYAQETGVTISGSVLDASGAVIPGAAIVVKEVRTGVKTSTVSGEGGHYNVPFLAPGQYEVSVELAGFRPVLRSGLHLATGDHPVLDFKLEVGQNTAEISIVDEAPLVDVANSATGQSITARQVEDMPLNGRNPMMIAQLAIGVIATGQPSLVHPFDNGAASAWSIGGTPSQTAEILMDGAPNGTWDNRMAYAPQQDAVQEVKVKAFDADASYGHTASGTINNVMKTGTNQLHGSAYWFGQPSALAANNLFNNRTGIAPQQTKLNQYGFTAGGPVLVPKVFDGRNKLFWFFGFEKLSDSQPNSKFLTVPTTSERSGDFSSLLSATGAADCVNGANGATKTGFNCYQIFNPYTGALSGSTVSRQPFFCDAAGNALAPTLTPGSPFGKQPAGTPCNKIPQQLLNQVALNYLKLYPQPNTAGSETGYGNFANSTTTDDDYSNHLGRLDWALNQRNRLSFNIRHNNQLQAKDNFFNNHTTGTLLNRENWGATLDHVFTINSSTVLDLRANYTKLNEGHPSPQSGFDASTLGFPGYIGANSTYPALPAINFGSSCGNTTTQASSFDCFGNTTSDFIPSRSYQLFGNVVKQLSSHTLKFGADGRKYVLDAQQYGAASGTYSFTSSGATSWTSGPASNLNTSSFGQDFAAFLLGLPTSGQYDINARGTFSSRYYAVFLQDDWRVKRSLTVNLGIRYDHDSPYAEKFGRTVNGFDSNNPNPVAQAAIAAYASSPIPQISSFAVPGGLTFASMDKGGIWQNTSHVVSPRIGFAWSPDRLRGNTVIRGGFGAFIQPLTMASLNPIGTYSSTPTLTQQGFSQTTPFVVPSNFLSPGATLSDPFPGGSFLQPAGSSGGLATFNGQNINFFAPQQKNPYSERWTLGVQHSFASDLLLEVAYIGNHAVHLPIAFTQVNGIPRQYLSTLPYRDQAAITTLTASVANPFKNLLPGTSLNGATTTARQLLAPFPEFPVADSTTFSSGVTERNATIGASYFESLNVRVEKRLSHGLSVISAYAWSKLIERDSWLNANDSDLEKRISPFDHPQHFVAAVNYTLPIGHGQLLNVPSGLADTLIGGWQVNGIYTYQTGAPILWMNGSTNNPGDYPICSIATVKGSCPAGANGLPQAATDFPSNLSFNNRQINGSAFDPSRFVTASGSQYQFHLRTIPTTFNAYRQDGINNFDASVIKNFKITEQKTFQFRAEAFNVLNHPTFGAPNTQASSTLFGTINTIANRPRQLQLGARFVF